MSILKLFLKEYNELYHESYQEEGASDALSQLRQVEKIMSNPKFHPTQELKAFYKHIKEQCKRSLKILLLGTDGLDKIHLINALLKQIAIPPHPSLASKRFIIKYAPAPFFKAIPREGVKDKEAPFGSSLHTLDTSAQALEPFEGFEIFLPAALLKNFELIKDFEGFKQDSHLKDADLYIWLLELNSRLPQQDLIAKIVKKKPTLALLTNAHKLGDPHEVLEKISLEKHALLEKFKLAAIETLSLEPACCGEGSLESACTLAHFTNLEREFRRLKTRDYDQLTSLLESSLAGLEALKQESKTTQAPMENQQERLEAFEESLLKVAQLAKNRRDHALLKEAFEKSRALDSHYKILFDHYKALDYAYHKENLNLKAKAVRFNNDYNSEILGNILKSFKRYLESIVDSILDNIETLKVRTRPNNASFLDLLINRHIVYETFQIRVEEVQKELEDHQSLLARQHKSLIAKINRFDTYLTNAVDESLLAFGAAIEEWIKRGHHLVLQKKPGFISMDGYFDLEEFNLGVYRNFTKKHHALMYDFVERIHTELTVLSVWVQATKKMLLECVVSRLQEKLRQDRLLAKSGRAGDISPLERSFIMDTILDILPNEIKELFCLLPKAKTQFDELPELLHAEAKENEKILRYRIKEIMELRQSMKAGTKILEAALKSLRGA